MALWQCADCTTLYAVGAPRCPHCGCKVRVEDGSEEVEDMAKNTVHGGPSNAAAEPEAEGAPVEESTSPEPEAPEQVEPKPRARKARTTKSAE